jgi:hypothetical protein
MNQLGSLYLPFSTLKEIRSESLIRIADRIKFLVVKVYQCRNTKSKKWFHHFLI